MNTEGWCSRCGKYVDWACTPPKSLGIRWPRRRRWEEWEILLSCGHRVRESRGRVYYIPSEGSS